MAQSFYFYDLETSGIAPKTGRIMQFAGQRTDMLLRPQGPPDNMLIKMTEDVLPEPEAVLITGLTPQATQADGITEADFLRYFSQEIAVPDTIFVGFNTVRFDDEFMRYVQYRNFYDPYIWQWQDGRSRWDILDVIRMTRALRPDGIKWPFDDSGKPTNRLELLTSLNGLEHQAAHDALSDVTATIAVARMIHNKQPKLFDFLLQIRDKNKVRRLVEASEPFIYTSGKYPSVYEKTTVAVQIGTLPEKNGALVYDLRHDPAKIAQLSPDELADSWYARPADETERFPVKSLQFNRCPAVAPLSVLDAASIERLKLSMDAVQAHAAALRELPQLPKKLSAALGILHKKRQAAIIAGSQDVDTQLYDGFFGDGDKTAMSMVRAAEGAELTGLSVEFKDSRLQRLLPLYKARNYPAALTHEEREAWELYKYQKLMGGGDKSRFSRYFKKLAELSARPDLSEQQRYLLGELQLWGESIMPEPPQQS